jgi:hypothetical protein
MSAGEHGDYTTAAALHLAKAHLEKAGWRYTAQDIGKTAGLILAHLTKGTTDD